MSKAIYSAGKRKRAIARATLKPGRGIVKVNSVSIDFYEPKIYRMRLREPLILAGDVIKDVDISINVNGGGMASQADAIRLAIARALVQHTKSERLKDKFLKYDRQLLVGDVRRKETSKPNCHGKPRAKVQKSYR